LSAFFKITAEVYLLELLAAYGHLFFLTAQANLLKVNEQFTEKLAMR
jgi:hypothetical protein